MGFLEKLKVFFSQKWTQVTEVAIACITVISAITGKVIDQSQVVSIVAAIGAAALGLIWLIETIAAVFGRPANTESERRDAVAG